MARQSIQDRTERVSRGCCPIHGIDMPQVGQHGEGDARRWIVACPRRDCEIRGTSLQYDGPVDLLPEFQLLVGGSPR
ncbi:hypothetical protein D3C77_89760 [compost metagenome]